jgi:flagellar biosynthesis anti-sigma factor FlgM
MRRTWNSWTYYGEDRESGRDEKGSVCQESWRAGKRTPDGRRGGILEDSFAQALERSMADALERAMDLSDVRNERVARVKLAIEDGTYHVPAHELAQKLVRNMLGEYR